MIISRTPLRISFAGGGSDMAPFYRHEQGAVLSTTIDKYIYIAVNKKFDNKIRVSYSITEIVDGVSELKHELVREALLLTGVNNGIEIVSISDIPSSGTGLGSSSAYTVGLLNALYAGIGRKVETERLAREACLIEIERCRKPIGKQDQYIASYGGFQYIQFDPSESVFVNPVRCDPKTLSTLQKRLLLLYTGLSRSSEKILRKQQRNTLHNHRMRDSLRIMTFQVHKLHNMLLQNDLDGFGEILHRGWVEKTKLATGITNSRIDNWYDLARRHGAIGGKLLGAGGGGFLLLYAEEDRHPGIIRALPELKPVSFTFEPQGSRIIYTEDNRK